MIGLALVPMAYTTMSASISNSLPGSGTGRRRPESSGSPSVMRTQRTPRTLRPSSPRISTGAASQLKRMPSCSAWWSSSARAGASARLRRYRQVTGSAPSRRQTRSASIAVLPAPITTTCLPGCSGVS